MTYKHNACDLIYLICSQCGVYSFFISCSMLILIMEKKKRKKKAFEKFKRKKKSLLWIYQSKSLSAPPYQLNHHCTLEKVIICMHSLETKTGHKKIYRKVLSFSEMNINVSFLLVPISDNIQTDLLSPFCHSPSNTRYQYWPLADRYPWQGQATTSQTYQHHWPKNTIKVAPLGSINASRVASLRQLLARCSSKSST